jgi:hypothetical protein
VDPINFVIFEFPHNLDGDVVYVDSSTAQRIHEERDIVSPTSL